MGGVRVLLFDISWAFEPFWVGLAPNHGAKACGPNGREGASTHLLCGRVVASVTNAIVVDGVAQVACLASSPCLVIANVSTRVDRLAFGGDHVALGTWLIGGMSASSRRRARRSGGGQFCALATARLAFACTAAEEAARLADEREYIRPCESA
jgi:hypothetical protein